MKKVMIGLMMAVMLFTSCKKEGIPEDVRCKIDSIEDSIEDYNTNTVAELTVTFNNQYLSTSDFNDGFFSDNPFMFAIYLPEGVQVWSTPSEDILPYVWSLGSDYVLKGCDVMRVLRENYKANKNDSLPLNVTFSGLDMTIKWTDTLANRDIAGVIILTKPKANVKSPALIKNWVTLSGTNIGYTYFDNTLQVPGFFRLIFKKIN